MLVVTRALRETNARRIREHGFLSSTTPEELVARSIDFRPYLKRLLREFDEYDPERPGEPPLEAYFVEPDLEVLRDKRPASRAPATAFVLKEWMTQSASSHLAILGEYGSGKTTLARKIARDLAERLLGRRTTGDARLPLLIPLREFPRGQVDVEVFVSGFIARYCGVENPNFDALRAMIEAGHRLLIFDGFDEMAVHVDEDVIQANIRQIESLALSDHADYRGSHLPGDDWAHTPPRVTKAPETDLSAGGLRTVGPPGGSDHLAGPSSTYGRGDVRGGAVERKPRVVYRAARSGSRCDGLDGPRAVPGTYTARLTVGDQSCRAMRLPETWNLPERIVYDRQA